MGLVPALLVGAGVGFIGSLVGAGGGFLLMPILLLVFGLPPDRAAAISLVTVAAASLAGTITHMREGRADLPAGLTLGAFVIPGALLGARLATVVPAGAFAVAFGGLLAALGAWMAVGGPARSRVAAVAGPGVRLYAAEPHGLGLSALGPLCAGMTGIGVVASLFGLGGGVLMVPLLTTAGRVEIHRAGAMAQLIMFCSATAGLVAFVAAGRVDWSLALVFAAGALVGAPLGAAASGRVPARRLQQLMGLCLLVSGGRLLFR